MIKTIYYERADKKKIAFGLLFDDSTGELVIEKGGGITLCDVLYENGLMRMRNGGNLYILAGEGYNDKQFLKYEDIKKVRVVGKVVCQYGYVSVAEEGEVVITYSNNSVFENVLFACYDFMKDMRGINMNNIHKWGMVWLSNRRDKLNIDRGNALNFM